MLSYKNGGTSCESDEWTVWGYAYRKKQEEGEGAEALVSASAQLYVLAGVLGCVRQLSQ